MVRLGMVATSRRDEVIRLRETGLSYAEIGRRQTPPISKERVRHILKGNPKPPKRNSKIMLRTGEVAQLLGVHINTVRRWSKKGILRAYRISSRGDRRFEREDVECFLKEREIE